MLLSLSPELWRAGGAWRLECGAFFRAVQPPMVQSLIFTRCFLVAVSFEKVCGKAFLTNGCREKKVFSLFSRQGCVALMGSYTCSMCGYWGDPPSPYWLGVRQCNVMDKAAEWLIQTERNRGRIEGSKVNWEFIKQAKTFINLQRSLKRRV